MRNLFYFLPVLTTRAGVNKYGIPQIGDNRIPGSRSNVLQCRQTDRCHRRQPISHLILPTNRSGSAVDLGEATVFTGKHVTKKGVFWRLFVTKTGKQMKLSTPLRRFNLIKCRQRTIIHMCMY